MKRMAIEAIYRKPNTSKPMPGHKIYPYLLRNLPVTKPDQVWATDITYVPMAHGFVYLVAVIDWFSRRFSAIAYRSPWKPSSASRRCRRPLRTWQAGNLQLGSGQPIHQRDFTSVLLKTHRHQHGRQRLWRDNVFIERLWRSVKWEEVYLRAYDTVSEARTSIGSYLSFYNSGRPHSSLNRQTPDQVYFNGHCLPQRRN